MPIHRVPKDEIENNIRRIEAAGEQVRSLTIDDEHVIVLTEPGPIHRGVIETKEPLTAEQLEDLKAAWKRKWDNEHGVIQEPHKSTTRPLGDVG